MFNQSKIAIKENKNESASPKYIKRYSTRWKFNCRTKKSYFKKNGGEIKVKTQEGEGAEFIIQLPIT